MRTVTAYPDLVFTQQYRRNRRRIGRRIRLTNFPIPSNPYRSVCSGSLGPQAEQPLEAKTILHFGNYTLGDENCLLLYGPDDIRY